MFPSLTAGGDSAGVYLCKNLLHSTCKDCALHVIYSLRETEREREREKLGKDVDEKTGAEQGEGVSTWGL